jgi:hypothetical protein
MAELTYQQIADLVSRLTYKPNVRIECLPSVSGHAVQNEARIMLTAYVPNSRVPHPPVEKVGLGFDTWQGPGSIPRRVPPGYRQEITDLIPVSLCQHVPYGLIDSEQKLTSFIRRLISEFESHEIDEWYRLDGKLVRDPHEFR